jgi:hypothetical protein
MRLLEAQELLDEAEDWWDRVRSVTSKAVDDIGRKRVGGWMRKTEQMVGNIFAERGEHRIKAKDLLQLGRIARHTVGKAIVEALGMTVASGPVPLEELEAEWFDAAVEFGPAGARWAAHRRDLRSLRLIASQK